MVSASIIILTKNAGPEFNKVLKSVTNQNYKNYEVIIIDSGSKDYTLKIAEKYKTRIVKIKPNKFNHGLTRNLGVKLAKGKYLVFLTQDAIPAKKNWLVNLIKPFKDQSIAGVYGKQIPKKNCNPLEKREIIGFDLISKNKRTVYCIKNPDSHTPKDKHIIRFFSNTNSCIIKELLEQIPFKKTNYAEDQIWMEEMIKRGYKKVYEPKAIVYHSHDASLFINFKRRFDHAMAMKKEFNYTDINIQTLLLGIPHKVYLDLKYLKRTKMDFLKKIYWLTYSPLFHFSKMCGDIIGKYYKLFPRKLINFFSLQKAIMKQ